MNLKALKQAQQQNSQLSSRRALTADQYYQQGLKFFEQAIAADFKDPDHLPQACQSFIQALKSNRADDRPCLMLAYLFMLLQDFDGALDYLKPVLERKPDHPQALEIKAQIQVKIQQIEALSQQQEPNQESELTEAHLAQTRQWILTAVRFSMEKALPLAVFDTAGIQDLQKQARMLHSQWQRFQTQIDALEAEFEVQELQQLILPLAGQNKRWQKLIENAETGQALTLTLQQELAQVEQVIQELNQIKSLDDLEIMEENYEALMDNAELYVEQVEKLTQSHPQPTELNSAYNALSAKIADFADNLDALASDFK